MKQFSYSAVLLFLLLGYLAPASSAEQAQEAEAIPLSEESQACLDCHMSTHPGLVADWVSSRHSRITPEMGLKKPNLERRISNNEVPEKLRSIAVGCYECHSLRPSSHADNFEHMGYQINVVVTPNDCETCHLQEARQYREGKKPYAVDNLDQNSIYHALVETIIGVQEIKNGEIVHFKPSEDTKSETCYGCHGTEVKVSGMKKLQTDLGEIEVPALTNWPNQGVGRINPDGSHGACTSCHPRHGFSIEIARNPYTCSQCHLEPDLPAWNVYKESKHGNIFLSKKQDYHLDRVPWRVGRDFRAPTCAACHNSLIVDPDGETIVPRSHNFGDRLWVRIFGLIYSHPQPKEGKTYTIKNKDGLPLPTTFTGEVAADFLIDKKEQKKRQLRMKKVCQSCHSSDWVNGQLARLDTTKRETDQMIMNATQLILQAWNENSADRINPFDEGIEQKWILQWLFYANSVRYATAMMGPDYASFKNGWWNMTKNLQDMKDAVHVKSQKDMKE